MNWFRSLSQVAKIGFVGGILFLFVIVGLLLAPRRENLSREDQVASAVSLLMQQAKASSQAPAQNSTSAPTETAAGISVEEGLLNVDITLPASLFSNSDLSTFDVDAYARENRFNKAVINEDGSITITLTKSRHKELLEEYAAQLNKNFTEMIGSEGTPYITAVTNNSDFTSVIVDVDRAGYESAFDLTPFTIGFSSMFYQTIAGMELHCEITIRDNATLETITTVIYPDALNNTPNALNNTPNAGRSSTTNGPTGTQELGSIQNPFPMGSAGSAWQMSDAGVRSDFTIKVLQIIRGKDANDYMAPDYEVNAAQPPSPGMEWMLVQVEITLISGGELQLHGDYFRTLSDGQVIEQAYIAQYDGPYPALNADLLLPGHETGWLYTTVNIDDTNPLIVFGMSYGGSADTAAFFALIPNQ